MKTKALNIQQYKLFFFILGAISLLSLVVYVYSINQTVRNVVSRQNMEVELMRLTSEIGEKEFVYIAKKNQITLEKAFAMGFKSVDAKVFVSRQSSVALVNGGETSQ